MRKDKSEQGWILGELVIICSVLVVVSSMMIPKIYTLYQMAAIEYETEHLLRELRTLQVLSRTADYNTDNAEGRRKLDQRPYLLLEDSDYKLMRGVNDVYTYHYLPGVHVSVDGSTLKNGIGFDKDGSVKGGLLTINVFAETDLSIKHKIRIDLGGRIRIERSHE